MQVWTGSLSEDARLKDYKYVAKKSEKRDAFGNITRKAVAVSHYEQRRKDGTLYGGGRNTKYSNCMKAPKERIAPANVAEIHVDCPIRFHVEKKQDAFKGMRIDKKKGVRLIKKEAIV